jgi:hypothetical protein
MKVKNKRKKGENKDIELTFHHFDFFPLPCSYPMSKVTQIHFRLRL